MKKAPKSHELSTWLHWLEQLHHKDIDLGLERIKQVAHFLNLQAFTCPVITIGGTNGKGSCVATLESIYLQAGYKVGAYTSPHILHFNERIRVNGQEVSNADIVNAFQIIERARGDVYLSFFEFATLAGLLIFQQMELDIILLEVGLGGRFDAVNMIDADVAVIASIDIDHTDWLGDSREKIGFEKAGIFRQGKYAICGDFNPPQVVLDHAAKIGANLFCHGRDFYFNVDNLLSIWDWHGPHVQLHALPLPHLAMQNVSSALMAYCCLAEKLPVSHQALTRAIESVRVSGRFQKIEDNPLVILDVAHNPAAAFMLSQRLKQELKPTQKLIAVFSALNDKEVSAIVEHLSEQVTEWYIAPLPSSRSWAIDDLKEELLRGGASNIKKFDDITTAYKSALLHSGADNCIIVFGSFYTVAEVLKYTHNNKFRIVNRP
jgi:dihydrofolate synthase/folylpolyglutamate synthase